MVNDMRENKTSIYCLLFCASILNFFVAFEGSFTIQSIIPVILITILIFFIRKEKAITLNIQTKILFFLNIEYTFALFINFFRHDIYTYSIIQLIYQIIISIWFLLITHEKYTKSELIKICKTIIFVFFICGLYVFIQNFIFQKQLSTVTTFLGKIIGKNHFSAWVSLSVLISFYFLIYSHKKIKYAIIFSLLVLSIVFMNSRGAILSSLICCLLVFFNYVFSNGINFKKVALILFTFLSAICLLKVATNIMPKWLYNRYFVKSYVDDSNTDRVYRWLNSFDGLKKQPIFGFGPGVFSMLPEYQITDFGKEINSSTPSHNTFVDVALNGGLIAIILFMYFLCTILIDFFKKYRLYIPIIAHLLINSMILGALKTVYFWTILIFLTILLNYLKTNKEINIFSG